MESGVNDSNCDRHPPRSRDIYKITGFGCISTCLKNVSFELLTSKLELTQNSYLFGGNRRRKKEEGRRKKEERRG
ncbi:MAG: hypothetical protein JGK30_18060 [Microcoleus sp. PH2017_40_RAT_O_B]|uniref:hypothetical protein n=1 Tax=Microcoleus sp. PH2017_08_TRC_O_A TaxID=2798819 RepID=UPI001D2166D7|nr:hypothetical protein [Microcoleus sp. PH2017_08_TRC_O_A]MCC3611327.1 hypothetical protein [Microcoleus sp. PH2017_40_RAT_O_B]